MHRLSPHNMPKTSFVIVDGGSTDRTAQIARGLVANNANILFLENPKRIQAAALNLAAATFGQNAEFLIRIDAHADYPNNYCKTLLKETEKTAADSIVVSMHSAGKTWFQKAVAAAQNSKLGNGGSAHRIVGKDGRWVDHGHHALMRVAAFRDCGGYDESFKHNEDAELDIRLRQKGYKIWLTNQTALTYFPRRTALALFRQYVDYGYGRGRTILKHRVCPKLRQMLPTFVAPAVILALATPLLPLAALPFVAWLILCLGYGVSLAVKSGDASIAMAGPAAMIMHFGWSLGFWKAFFSTRRRL